MLSHKSNLGKKSQQRQSHTDKNQTIRYFCTFTNTIAGTILYIRLYIHIYDIHNDIKI